MIVEMLESYGPFKKMAKKRVISTGQDFYVLSAKGTHYCVRKQLCKIIST